MHKTYLDTYKLLGFTGGDWAYAINTNETSGVPCSPSAEKVVPTRERRLAVYLLGWESIEVCSQFALQSRATLPTIPSSSIRTGPKLQCLPRRWTNWRHTVGMDLARGMLCLGGINKTIASSYCIPHSDYCTRLSKSMRIAFAHAIIKTCKAVEAAGREMAIAILFCCINRLCLPVFNEI
jgi:hypothetical protein